MVIGSVGVHDNNGLGEISDIVVGPTDSMSHVDKEFPNQHMTSFHEILCCRWIRNREMQTFHATEG